jgi:transcriptional/translational regulatory protein YebC/TACO1
VASGHNRWSTIKHDKGKNDAQKNRLRSILAKELMLASKCTRVPGSVFVLLPNAIGADYLILQVFGQDPASNPRLATAITTAKKG